MRHFDTFEKYEVAVQNRSCARPLKVMAVRGEFAHQRVGRGLVSARSPLSRDSSVGADIARLPAVVDEVNRTPVAGIYEVRLTEIVGVRVKFTL
jgi:hypothetical protein